MATGLYFYYGEDCTRKLHYMCKLVDDDESNNFIENYAREVLQRKQKDL